MIVNVIPMPIAIAFLMGTMRVLGMALNALTAMILPFSNGLAIAYSVRTTHRFVGEYDPTQGALLALVTTLSGRGGALIGNILTTPLERGAPALTITPVPRDVSLLMTLSEL